MRGLGPLLLAILLIAVAPLGDAARAAGLGRAATGGWMVLCSEIGVVTVPAGPDGRPQTDDRPAPPIRHCPDCLPLPQPAAAPPALTPVARPVTAAQGLWTGPRPVALASRSVPRPAARGPPMVT